MKKVHAQRLLKLADFLETVPRNRFDFNTYIGEDWQGAQDLSCGTTACALGWAATMPAFRRLGVVLVGKYTHGSRYGGVSLKKPILTTHGRYVQAMEEDVSRIVFGLSGKEHKRVFTPHESGLGDENVTPKQVAKHIRNFVKQNGWEE